MNSSTLTHAAKTAPAVRRQSVTLRQTHVPSRRPYPGPVRLNLIRRIRAEISAQTYESDEKLSQAIDQLLASL